MKIDFLKASEINVIRRCTAHYNGRLGFNIEGAEYMKLENAKCVFVGIAEDFNETSNLVIKTSSEENEDGFPVLKSGDYYYIAGKKLLKHLKLSYTKYKYYFDITRIEGQDDENLFLLEYNKNERTTKNDTEENTEE